MLGSQHFKENGEEKTLSNALFKCDDTLEGDKEVAHLASELKKLLERQKAILQRLDDLVQSYAEKEPAQLFASAHSLLVALNDLRNKEEQEQQKDGKATKK